MVAGYKIWLVVMAAFIIPRSVATWTTPENISNTSLKSNRADMAVDRNGHLHVVWGDFYTIPNEPGDILYRHFDGDTWSGTVSVSNDTTESWRPKIAVDTVGHPHVIWEDWGHWTRPKIRYSRFDGDSFTTPFNLSDSLSGAHPFARIGGIAVDRLNNVHVVWSDEISGMLEVYHTKREGNSWSDPVNISNNQLGMSAMPEIAIDSSDCLHVVWLDYRNSQDEDSCEIYYSKSEGDTWTTPINISNIPGQSWDEQMAVSQEGYPHVVWSEESCHLYYSFFDGSSWSTPYYLNDVTGEDEGYSPDLAVDAGGNVHVVWGGDGPELWHTFYNGIIWSAPFDVSGSPRNSVLADIVTDQSGWIHCVWGESGEIWYSNHFVICGDCNGDENITFADALYVKDYYFQIPPGSPAPIGEGDVNLDGRITFADALYIKNYYFQTPPGFPAPCEPPLSTPPFGERCMEK
nr:MAG: hypothetical protein AM324_05175 [Candidatus Thorarchaeota archaeon SMTZ1-83]